MLAAVEGRARGTSKGIKLSARRAVLYDKFLLGRVVQKVLTPDRRVPRVPRVHRKHGIVLYVELCAAPRRLVLYRPCTESAVTAEFDGARANATERNR